MLGRRERGRGQGQTWTELCERAQSAGRATQTEPGHKPRTFQKVSNTKKNFLVDTQVIRKFK